MMEEHITRRLAAVLAADIAGYSRMMEADEPGTLAVLRQIWSETFNPAVAERHGRIVKMMGDGALVEFASVVDAVECAVAIQRAMGQRNLAAEQPVEFRVGINLGDIVSEGTDIFGNGVNVAARLEALADPGGICISGKVRDELTGRIEFAAHDLGEVRLKNIAGPVRAFRLMPETLPRPAKSEIARRGDERSIAVLAFVNLSADPDQEYFSDGITEDIITDLSRIAGLMVVARNSSFAYKNKQVDARTIGVELGVRSILEGSVRRAGNRIRITAQLIDATNGLHLWAERYDRELTNIFEVQDEVTHRIVDALEVTLRPAERARVGDGRASNIEAHDWFLRGRELMLGPSPGRATYDRAVAAFRRAIALDPGFAQPYAGLAMAHCLDFQNHWSDTPDALDLAAHFAAEAVDKGPNEPLAHFAAAVVAVWKRDLAKAKAEAERALELNPNYALAYGTRGQVEVYLGHPLDALPLLERAIRLDPGFTQQYTHFLGMAYFGAGQYERAASTFRERIRLSPRTDVSRVFLASALGHAGDTREAQGVWRELLEISPNYSLAEHLARLPFQNRADVERISKGLGKAGLPD